MKVKYLLLSLASLLAVACSDYESFSDDPGFRLTFSSDTVAFDTLISTIPSSTKTFYAFNNNGDGMRINSVELESGAESRFRVNVDGRYLVGGKWQDFEVMSEDSLVIRVEMTPPEVGTNEPLYFQDRLLFHLANGVTQTVVLTGGSVDAYICKEGLVIEENTTLLTDKAYVIYDSLVVREDATLTLTEGTTLMFHDKAMLRVYGRLLVEGSIEKPVILRGDRMDHMFDYLKYDNTPGRWEGVVIKEGSLGNHLVQCDIHSARHGIVCESTDQEDPDPAHPAIVMEDCILHNIGGHALLLNSCASRVTNTQISNTLLNSVQILGGDHTFTYCTIAQFYPFIGGGDGQALCLISSDEQGGPGFLHKAHFINCVITGYGSDVIQGMNIVTDSYTCDYLFHHCFINTPEDPDDTHFVGCIYDRDKKSGEVGKLVRQDNFRLFDSEKIRYDFTPKPESRICSLADGSYPDLPVFDRRGVSRLADDGPDAGCYEYAAPAEEEQKGEDKGEKR